MTPRKTSPRPVHTATQLQQLADRCVKCGMCLQQCPTYGLTRDEGESPRGRIALIQGLVAGQLAYSENLDTHLGNCLKCRACERVCPSMVPYGELIDAAQTYIERTQRAHRPARGFLLSIATDPTRLRIASAVLRFYQRSGLQALVRVSGVVKLLGLKKLDAQLPPLEKPGRWNEYYPATGPHRGDIALFTGCIADAIDARTTRSAITVLTALGYGVHIPRAQRCCGALHLHNGEPEQADRLARANVAAFDLSAVAAVISTATGCGATLAEYGQRESGATDFARKVIDISTFLTSVDWPNHVKLKPLPQRIAVHDPCSLTHVLRQAERPYALLRKIPGIELMSLPDKSRCCGAAGSYMVTHPDTADRLRDAKIEGLAGLNAQTLVSSNIGCALHLAAGLRARQSKVEVIHPVTLLARQLDVR